MTTVQAIKDMTVAIRLLAWHVERGRDISAREELQALRRNMEDVAKNITDEPCGLPPNVIEALNSGDGTYRP